MARPKSNKKTQSINFDIDVLEALKKRCDKEGVLMSTFVNSVVRKKVMSDYTFYCERARYYNSKFHEAKFLMETAPDRPEEKK